MIKIYVFQIDAGPEYGIPAASREAAHAEMATRLVLAGGLPFKFIREYAPAA